MAEVQPPSSEKNFFPSLDRGQMLALGWIFLFLGILQFAGVAWFVSRAEVIRGKKAGEEVFSRSACRDNLKNLSFTVEDVKESNNILRASKQKMDDPALRLGEASVATLVCPGWQLTNFCMGDGCEKVPGGIWLEITASK